MKKKKKRKEWKKRTSPRQSLSGDDSLYRQCHPARACRIRARCICNEGCAPPIAATSRHYALALHKTAGRLHRQSRRLSRSRSCSCARARARYLSSPGHWNAIPRADDLYLANARPRGRMSHVPSLCLYRPPRKYPAAHENERASERVNERSLTQTHSRIAWSRKKTSIKCVIIIQWQTIREYL